jgi:hypothetical protein
MGALAFLESHGGYAGAIAKPFTDSALLKMTVAALEVDLSTGNKPEEKSLRVPLQMIVSLEKTVLNTCRPLYPRALAWYRLVKLWGSLRFDDTLGMDPSLMNLHEGLGLTALLERTKVSGPGRKIGWLNVFIGTGCWISETDWLRVGWEIWCGGTFSFRRDYFLPLPEDELQGAIPILADYSAAMALNRKLLTELEPQSLVDGVWISHSDEKLFPDRLAPLWTEHSDRNWLVSAAYDLDLPKDKIDFLGRWGARKSDDYNRAARQATLAIQAQVAEVLRNDPSRIHEVELTSEVRKRLRNRGFDTDDINREVYWLELGLMSEPPKEKPRTTPQEIIIPPGAESAPPAPASPATEYKYVLSLTNKGRFKRLHLFGGCWRIPGVNFADYSLHESLEQVGKYDDICKDCWKEGAEPADSSSEETSSESEDSDATPVFA